MFGAIQVSCTYYFPYEVVEMLVHDDFVEY
jgi:hypothetical protein